MTERIVIMLAYHYPPDKAIGAERPYRFCKYLRRMGYRVHVISAADPREAPEPDTDYIPDPFVVRPRAGPGWYAEVAIRRIAMPGAVGVRWAHAAFCAAEHLCACIKMPSSPLSQLSRRSARTWPPGGFQDQQE